VPYWARDCSQEIKSLFHQAQVLLLNPQFPTTIMADDAERRLLEDQLELQLQEQRDSIAELDEALASDPNNPEILELEVVINSMGNMITRLDAFTKCCKLIIGMHMVYISIEDLLSFILGILITPQVKGRYPEFTEIEVFVSIGGLKFSMVDVEVHSSESTIDSLNQLKTASCFFCVPWTMKLLSCLISDTALLCHMNTGSCLWLYAAAIIVTQYFLELTVHSELLQAIKDAEEGLFVLKRARLLQEVDFSLQMAKDGAKGVNQDSLASKDVEVEPLEEAEDVNQDLLDSKDAEVEPLKEYSVGSKCRFRHSDGRWYDGLIVAMEGSTGAKVSFLTPTSENQLVRLVLSLLVCKFFLQQRCRFGMKCRSSHGIDLPLSSLKKYNPTIWNQSLVGSTVWATSDSKTGIWREAELESWDDKLKLGRVVFRDDGSSLNVGNESISLSEYAQMSDEDDSDDSYSESDHYDPTDYEIEDSSEGIGFLGSSNLQRGIQTETAIFAKWENHTRGIASKMMANMGFREGMGLGLKGQGRIDPISVKVLPPKQSLDHALESVENRDTQEKKRSRGGKRKRDKKFAAAVRAAKQQEEPSSDIFSLINTQLAMHDEALKSGSGKKQQKKEFQAGKNGERRALVAFDDEVKELRARVQKLEEMASRNKKEKVVYDAALRKLHETQKTLAEVEAAHASASNAVANKEKEKRWLKF
ncbi:G-patch domain-containing protein, partial [Cynara cardunculus var. scolymus]